jgi:hypothetical protein
MEVNGGKWRLLEARGGYWRLVEADLPSFYGLFLHSRVFFRGIQASEVTQMPIHFILNAPIVFHLTVLPLQDVNLKWR